MVEPHYFKVGILLSCGPGNMLGHESGLMHFSRACLYEKVLCLFYLHEHMALQWEESQRGNDCLAFLLAHMISWPLTLILFEPIKYSVTLVQTKGFISDFPCFSYSKFIHCSSSGDFAKQKKSSVYTNSSTLRGGGGTCLNRIYAIVKIICGNIQASCRI